MDGILLTVLIAIACAVNYYAGFTAGEYKGFRKGADSWHTGWKPIETASPSDGWLLVWHNIDGLDIAFVDCDGVWWNGYHTIGIPTHWMPWPEPPEGDPTAPESEAGHE